MRLYTFQNRFNVRVNADYGVNSAFRAADSPETTTGRAVPPYFATQISTS